MVLDAFIRDINSQPLCIRNHREKLLNIVKTLEPFRNSGAPLVLTGIASSLYAMEGACTLLASQIENPPILINTSDLLDYNYETQSDMRPLLVMSRSGESAEILRLLNESSANRVVIGITEGLSSALAKRSDILLDFEANEEAFPNTISFLISQLYALAVAYGLGYKGQKELRDLLSDAEEITQDILDNLVVPSSVGERISKSKAVLVEGQGTLSGIVNQYTLDFHETRKPGISVTGGIMRHGVIELTEDCEVLTMLLIPNDSTEKRKANLANELAKAGKQVVVLTDGTSEYDQSVSVVRLPAAPKELKSISFTIGMQKIYEQYVLCSRFTTVQPEKVSKVTREE